MILLVGKPRPRREARVGRGHNLRRWAGSLEIQPIVNRQSKIVNLANDQVNGDGGGIYNSGTLTVTNSTFSANNGDDNTAGGIYNGGTLYLYNTLIANTSKGYDCIVGALEALRLALTGSPFVPDFFPITPQRA